MTSFLEYLPLDFGIHQFFNINSTFLKLSVKYKFYLPSFPKRFKGIFLSLKFLSAEFNIFSSLFFLKNTLHLLQFFWHAYTYEHFGSISNTWNYLEDIYHIIGTLDFMFDSFHFEHSLFSLVFYFKDISWKIY